VSPSLAISLAAVRYGSNHRNTREMASSTITSIRSSMPVLALVTNPNAVIFNISEPCSGRAQRQVARRSFAARSCVGVATSGFAARLQDESMVRMR
jgi:hypothetical protein